MVFGDGNKSSKGKCSCSPHLSLYHQPHVGNSVLLWDVGVQVFWAVSTVPCTAVRGMTIKKT